MQKRLQIQLRTVFLLTLACALFTHWYGRSIYELIEELASPVEPLDQASVEPPASPTMGEAHEDSEIHNGIAGESVPAHATPDFMRRFVDAMHAVEAMYVKDGIEMTPVDDVFLGFPPSYAPERRDENGLAGRNSSNSPPTRTEDRTEKLREVASSEEGELRCP